MAFQSSVNQKLAVGVVGDFALAGDPRRVSPYTIASSSAGSIGKAYTIDSTDPSKVNLGGSGVFAGIAVNSKEYVRNGLSATLDFNQYDECQLCTMGSIWLSIADTVTVGMAAYFNTTTGVITAAASGETIEGCTEIKGSQFIWVDASSTEPMCVLQLG